MKKFKFLSFLFCMFFVTALFLTSCNNIATVQAKDLMEGISANNVEKLQSLESGNVKSTDFAVKLLQRSKDGDKNIFLSPLSILSALGMTMNGASGETLSQMEETLGFTASELNSYLYTYCQNLPNGDKYKVKLANSIWFKDDDNFTVERQFLQTNADYYGANCYKTPFDNQTLKDINNWVNENTDGLIKKVLDQIPQDAVAYLINTLIFDAEWPEHYKKNQVRNDTFYKPSGEEQVCEFMFSTEYIYLEDEKATGFIKTYYGYKYAFAALLPNENVSIEEYVNSLEGETLHTTLGGKKGNYKVFTSIPKFETEYSTSLNQVLCDMGMVNAFSPLQADFSNLGNYEGYNLYINNVIHKTKIEMGEKGTKAGAVTVVEMNKASAQAPSEEIIIKQVYLTRPFVYMIIDFENKVPLFIGTLNSVK